MPGPGDDNLAFVVRARRAHIPRCPVRAIVGPDSAAPFKGGAQLARRPSAMTPLLPAEAAAQIAQQPTAGAPARNAATEAPRAAIIALQAWLLPMAQSCGGGNRGGAVRRARRCRWPPRHRPRPLLRAVSASGTRRPSSPSSYAAEFFVVAQSWRSSYTGVPGFVVMVLLVSEPWDKPELLVGWESTP